MMEGYKDSPLGKIPIDWKVEKLGKLANSFAGGTPNRSVPDYYNGTIPWIKSGEVNNNSIKGSEEHITELALKESSAKIIKPNSILVAMYGATAGKVGILKVKASSNQAVLAINSRAEILSNSFLYHYLKKSTIELLNLSQGSGQPNLSKGIIDSVQIPIPPLPEQQKIADILSTLDAKIDIIDQQITETQELKKGLMQRLLTKGIGHTEFKDSPLGRIPKSWEVVRLNQVGDIVTGTTPKTSVREYYTENGVLWASPADLGKQKYIESTNKQLTNLGFQQTRKLPPKSIMVTCIGSTIGKIGMTNSNMSTNQQINSIVCNESNCPEFYYYLIEKIAVYIKSLAGTQAVPLLNKTDFSAINVVNPPMQEQKIISEILKTLDEKTEILSEKKETYQVLKQGLMQQLLTGKIRVKV